MLVMAPGNHDRARARDGLSVHRTTRPGHLVRLHSIALELSHQWPIAQTSDTQAAQLPCSRAQLAPVKARAGQLRCPKVAHALGPRPGERGNGKTRGVAHVDKALAQRVGVEGRRQLPGGIELGWARTAQQVGGALCDGLKKGLHASVRLVRGGRNAATTALI